MFNSLGKGTGRTKLKAVALHMRGHPNTIRALAVTLHIHTKFVHSLIVEHQPLLTLIETVVHTVGCHCPTMLTIACAELLLMLLEVFAVIINLNIDYRV